MKIISGLFIVLSVLLINNPSLAINIKVSDSRENNFYMDALKWVLDKSGEEYKIIPTTYPLSSQKRKIILLKNEEIDIIYAGTSKKLEDELLPIRFPIMRGLSGNRLFIINKNYQNDYNLVNNINDLKKYVGFQGIGWEDTQILEASGLEQVTRLYDNIFISINAGSSYYFPRGMTEVFSELVDKKQELPNLDIEKKIVLAYKTAVFFFVNPSNTKLAKIIETGFINGYKDGSYERFFYSHPLIKSSIEQANLQNRLIIEISNPLLSSDTDAIAKQYWHQD